ncbi:MAG: sigma-54-dependent Fis family transcriptional regulator [Gammaproteobacteria bacterium]|nr:sigma-54-dependent Fis family transcriptional regulator [Gammaproteobacteria bacterium]
MNFKNTSIKGDAPSFLRVVNAARMVAGTGAPVLISGEEGAGRETLAREIHHASPRQDGPFVVVNCPVVTGPELQQALESGAATLFLNALGELQPDAQMVLLSYLESGESRVPNAAHPRIISSTSADLTGSAGEGTLREDLFYRLYVVSLEVPSLREREGDIVLLLKHFTAGLAGVHGRSAPRYSVTARNLLKRYRWPGNVRELKNFCERMVILMAGQMIQPENLPSNIRNGVGQSRRGSRFILPADGINLQELESDMIRQALGLSGGNRSKAARLLGITRDTLLYRIQKHAIES